MKTFYWLVKREFWENRGSFLFAPVICGGVVLLLTLMGVIAGEVFRSRAGVHVSGMDFAQLRSHLDAGDLDKFSMALDITMLVPSMLIGLVLFFVVFFYCTNTLADERRDRSILFWKSLPISDRATVLSKVVSAVVVAPVIATLAGIAAGLALLVLLAIAASFHGVNLWEMLWSLPHPLRITAHLLSNLPLYVVWSLPTVGWLMLCSAWARSKQFLWALALPIGSGILVGWFGLMDLFHRGTLWYWKNIVGRLLLSVFPGGWMPDHALGMAMGGADASRMFVSLTDYSLLLTPPFLIGAVAGIVMIAGAIWLRRWRVDG
ncbi:hypothetical protein [Fulvimonas soli]|jgi:ABC-2 type transport system permease protein|uniref:ABC-2 type transport system permease protein n=1 Tax=Fulvimonas soli TaxID=155197 RepID=A0A316IAR9_9GAMM|nr:hypothetical protein [Fulvimonas soli]PWK89896.1 ABC-2 type transport system permease protein [Fulvimonas soli]TNY25566.1 hypothetical protein BV497_13250 [Fulvimonas soli]